jgi:putative ABC transport system permease protein
VARIALRGVVQRKLRAAITALAVFLGVSFIAGSFVLTDTINASFEDIFSESLEGTDVVVSAETENVGDQGIPPAFPAELLDRARRVEGVEDAAGSIFSLARFVDEEGDSIGNQFAPNFVSSTLPERFESLTYVEGRQPESDREASLDTQTADNGNLEIGDTLRIAGDRRVTQYEIVGMTKLGETSFGGAGIAQVPLDEAQRVVGKEGKFDQISIAAEDGVNPDELRRRVDRVMPPSVQVETGTESADRQSEEIAEDLSFIRVILLVLGGIALLVGSFLIFNTFAITVAQRIRELGMLRTLGASRRQLLGSMILEASVLGGTGSLLGIPGGIGAALALNSLFKSFGIDLPNTGTVVATRTIVVALLVGILVTLLSALSPALRATRVSPMAALREAELPESRRRGRVYAVVALAMFIGGLGLTAAGLFGGAESGAAAGMVGGGAVITLFGVSLFSPRLVRPIAAIAGWPLERLRGLTGRLARENAVRKPGRTAVTSAALMIGLAVVVFVTVFAAGLSDSVGKAIDRNFEGQITLQNVDGFSPIPARAGIEAEQTDGVALASEFLLDGGRMLRPRREEVIVTGVEPRETRQVLSLDWEEGSPAVLSRLSPSEAVVDDAWADSSNIGVGDEIAVRTPTEKVVRFTVKGTVKDNADLLGNLVVPNSTLRSQFGTQSPTLIFLRLEPGADPARVQRAISRPIEQRYPTVEVLNQEELKDKIEDQIQQLVGLLYALLAMAVLVSLLGIVTTLALSIHERTRELGMLRAVGMSRRQVRTMVRYEAVITALIGAVLGMALGVIFAALVSRPLADEGFTLAYPIATLILLLVLAALAGVVSAIWPARRAARLDVLRALAYE